MSAPLRVAVIGAGLMGRWHADAAARNGARIVAVADPNPARCQALARRHGASAFDGLPAALNAGPPDIVHLCTPAGTHRALATSALEAGAHVLAEKPLAPDAAGTSALFELARREKRLLCPVHQFLFQRGVLSAGRAIETRIAPLLHLDYTACSAGGSGRSQQEIDDISLDILPHPLSLVRRLLGQPLRDLALEAARASAGELRVTGHSGQRSVSLLISMGGRPTSSSMRLIGGGGTIHLDLFHGFAVVERGATSRAQKIAHPLLLAGATMGAAVWNLGSRAVQREPAYPGLRELVRRFFAAVRGNEPCPITAEEALDVARARDAVIRAIGPT